MDEPKWELGHAPCCGLGSEWLVSVSTGPLAKERKGLLPSMGGKAAWEDWRGN